ncbi:MAG: 4'-phosphopantetheinyl transferase superfamily protein [Clostridiales bacterium]|nr:4'-phosphopantetheinyl transferase superfamily protein [Clostridiales bacterium]
MVEIYAVKVQQEFTESEYESFLALVSEEKREKMRKKHRNNSDINSIIGEVLARYAIRKRIGIMNSEIHFSYRDHGKPYIIGMEQLSFNISHSGDWVVCAVGNQEVGIDIEKIKSSRVKVAKRFFTKAEYGDLIEQPEAQQATSFCKLWTLKEAYLKWSGKGLTEPLDSFWFEFGSNNSSPLAEKKQIQLITDHEHCLKDADKLNFRQYKIDNDYELSVCSMEDDFCEEVNIISIRQLEIE